MGKNPAFLFYPNDWLGGTMGMTFEEKGAYIDLLILQFNRGHMTSHMIGQAVGQMWNKLEDKFIRDSQGLFYNERLEIEIKRRERFVESRVNNKKGINQHTLKNNKKGGHMTSHMENENENENNKIIRYGILLEKVITESKITLPDGFKDLILEWLKYKSEKGQSYKPTGLKNLILGFLQDTNSDLTIANNMLRYSMKNNYSGLYKENKSNERVIANTGRRIKNTNALWGK
jgi:hypothetical protein